MEIIKNIEPEEYEDVKGYDGNLNSLTFNLVKSSKAFDNNRFDYEEIDTNWFDNNN